jgi:murein DD-endopeptidase MepM/ murein hydrolase activator NlpD
LIKAGARLGCALIVAGTISTQGAVAQSPSTQESSSPSTTQTADTKKTSTPQVTPRLSNFGAEPIEQQPAAAVVQSTAIVPPAPFVVKREESLIAIPDEESPAVPLPKPEAAVEMPRMEGIVTLPKMEGIVSVPVRVQGYEIRPAVASSSSVKIGSSSGYRRDPFTRRAKFHSGVDIKAKWGDPIAASQAGRIQFAGWYHGYGNLVIVDHGGGITTYYAHLSSFEVTSGDLVQRGTVVGNAGSTGRATSPHLHYEVRINGNAINPFQQVALDPSSAYFKTSRPAAESGPASTTTAAQKSMD